MQVGSRVAATPTRSCKLSRCRRYRYLLEIVWDARLPMQCIVGLNPSTADLHTDDPTLRRCIRYCQDWGKGGLRLVNLFALRTPDPKLLRKATDPVGTGNSLRFLRQVIASCPGPPLAAWGRRGMPDSRAMAVVSLSEQWLCLATNLDGSPKHPLYCRTDLQPQPWRQPWCG